VATPSNGCYSGVFLSNECQSLGIKRVDADPVRRNGKALETVSCWCQERGHGQGTRKGKRARGQEGKRARGQEGERARGREGERSRVQEGERARVQGQGQGHSEAGRPSPLV